MGSGQLRIHTHIHVLEWFTGLSTNIICDGRSDYLFDFGFYGTQLKTTNKGCKLIACVTFLHEPSTTGGCLKEDYTNIDYLKELRALVKSCVVTSEEKL